MAALGNGQAGGREAESRDVYHTGMLFFKTGTFVSVHGAKLKRVGWREEGKGARRWRLEERERERG